MFETTRFESERRLPAAVVIGIGLSAFAAMMVLIAPGVLGDVDIQALVARLPPGLVEQFRLREMGTVEGFLAIEFYQFLWLLGLGGYVAYAAGGTIAGDAETDRLDTLLSAPLSRSRLLLEKYLALLTAIVVVNLVVLGAVYTGFSIIEEPLVVRDLAAVHVLSLPYFLTCAAWGMVVSVLASRRLVAEGLAVGGVIGAFLLNSAVSGTDLSPVGAIAPMRYYDPLTVLTAGDYDLAGAGILLLGTGALLIVSIQLFQRADIQ